MWSGEDEEEEERGAGAYMTGTKFISVTLWEKDEAYLLMQWGAALLMAAQLQLKFPSLAKGVGGGIHWPLCEQIFKPWNLIRVEVVTNIYHPTTHISRLTFLCFFFLLTPPFPMSRRPGDTGNAVYIYFQCVISPPPPPPFSYSEPAALRDGHSGEDIL